MGLERLVRTVVLGRLKRKLPLKSKKSLKQKTREQTDAYTFIVYLSSAKYGFGPLVGRRSTVFGGIQYSVGTR